MGERKGSRRCLAPIPSTITNVTGQEMGKKERRREVKMMCSEGRVPKQCTRRDERCPVGKVRYTQERGGGESIGLRAFCVVLKSR